MKKQIISALFIVFIELSVLQAQQVITASGGNASGSGGSVSYSIGQVAYTTCKSANGSVEQGVQQAFEIIVVSTPDVTNDISLNYLVYPNPTIDFLNLKIKESASLRNHSLYYWLFDQSGKLLDHKKIENHKTVIDMQNHIPAIYFLKVTDNTRELKTFKIIKH